MLSALQCFHKAGFPTGLINLVTGKGSEIGDFLTMHPAVNCISFTGGDTGERQGRVGRGPGRACRLDTRMGEGVFKLVERV